MTTKELIIYKVTIDEQEAQKKIDDCVILLCSQSESQMVFLFYQQCHSSI